MRVYLDNCCFNRPFDDQDQLRVRLETEAKLDIQGRILRNELTLVWSYMLDFENAANPFAERREEIAWWRGIAEVDVDETDGIAARAAQLAEHGIAPKDALHAACALEAACDVFVTTDDRLLRKLDEIAGMSACNPIAFVMEHGT